MLTCCDRNSHFHVEFQYKLPIVELTQPRKYVCRHSYRYHQTPHRRSNRTCVPRRSAGRRSAVCVNPDPVPGGHHKRTEYLLVAPMTCCRGLLKLLCSSVRFRTSRSRSNMLPYGFTVLVATDSHTRRARGHDNDLMARSSAPHPNSLLAGLAEAEIA